jgi:hypothetical protein
MPRKAGARGASARSRRDSSRTHDAPTTEAPGWRAVLIDRRPTHSDRRGRIYGRLMTAAIFGLLGVLLGGMLNGGITWALGLAAPRRGACWRAFDVA